jgi:hypothetical protein
LQLVKERSWRKLGMSGATVAVLSVVMYAPFWDGPQTLMPVLFQTGRVVWSPGALLISIIGPLDAHTDLAVRVACAGLWPGVVWLVARRAAVNIAFDTAIVLLATLLLLTTAFFAHYLVPIVALVAVAGNRRLESFTVALSIGALAAYSVELLAPAMPADWIGSRGYQALGSLLTLGPAMLVLVAPLIRPKTVRSLVS